MLADGDDEAKLEAELQRLELEHKQAEQLDTKTKKKGVKPKHKTFNQLDPRFQLNDSHDPEHIFPEELDMVAQLRERIPELAYYSDKFVVFFLCARRHHIEETHELIERYLAKRKQFGWAHTTPKIFEHAALQEMFADRAVVHTPGSVDKHGRLVTLFWVKKMGIGRPLDAMMAWSIWESEWLVHSEPLKYLRNGTVWVMDMDGFSLFKNIDTSPDGRAWSQAISGSFPTRVRGIYFFNAGILVRGLMSVAKWVLPKKLMKRLQQIKKSDLTDLIPDPAHRPPAYGGTLTFDWDKSMEEMREIDNQLRRKWRKVKKELRAKLEDDTGAPHHEHHHRHHHHHHGQTVDE